MPDYNTQMHGTPTAASDPSVLKRRHWMLALWFLLIWSLTGFAFLVTMSPGSAVALSLVGLGTGFIAAWLLGISASPLRRNLYAFGYFCMTIGFGTNLLLLLGIALDFFQGGYAGDLFLFFLISPLPFGPAFALESPWPFGVPFLGILCWSIAKYKIKE